MKKSLFFFFSFIVFQFAIFSFDIRQEFPNTIVPISNISIARLWEADKDDSSMEDFYYQQEIWKLEDEYKKTLTTTISKDKSLIGYWYLTDSKNKIIKEQKNGPIQFSLLPDGISYQRLSSSSYLYEIDNKSYIVFPTWDAGMIRMLKIYDDKLFIYNLDGDTWYLDDIHKNGSYYKKY